jgi:hypothetical protein
VAWLGALALGPWATVLASSASGCGLGIINYCMPDEGVPPPICYGGGGTGGVGDAGEDASDAGSDAPPFPPCAGQCAPLPPLDWSNPELLWIGPAQQVPACPAVASAPGYSGYVGLDASTSCPPCQCNPPTGSCGLPATITVSAEPCAEGDADAGGTPFDPPAGWDGGCTGNDGLDAGTLCDGSPCAQSATIGPLTVDETGCTPQAPTVSPPPITWQSAVLVCHGMAYGACDVSGETCTPAPPPGFSTCVFQDGDSDCDAPLLAPYTQKILAYGGVSDDRSCSACTCGPPAGSVCTAEISLFPDGMCASSMPNANPVDSTKPVCVDLITGTALGSKSAGTPTYSPGTCPAGGGALLGSAVGLAPKTFCCIPTPLPPPRPGAVAKQ